MTALTQQKNIKSIVLIDDDVESRVIIRRFVATILPEVKIYSAEDGISGLGAVFVDKPDCIIVDTTLPKYSGLEVIDFIATNAWIKESNVPIIIMHEGKVPPAVDSQLKNFILVSKKDEAFFLKCREFLLGQSGVPMSEQNKLPTSRVMRIRERFFGTSLRLSTLADQLRKRYFMQNSVLKVITFCEWLSVQVVVSVFIGGLLFLTREPKKLYAPAVKKEYAALRLQTYPTIIMFVLLGTLLLGEIALLLTGGVVIFNKRITSIFAAGDNTFVVDLSKSDRDTAKTVLKDGVLSLAKKAVPVTAIPTPTLSPSVTPTVSGTDVPTAIVTPVITETPSVTPTISDTPSVTPTETPTTTSTPVTTTSVPTTAPVTTEAPTPTPSVSSVLGASTVSADQYETESGPITFTEQIPFTKIKAILEQSTVLTDVMSVEQEVVPQDKKFSDIREELFVKNGVQIRYQISTDNKNWWYLNDEKTWEKTENGAVSANTVNEINEFIHDFVTKTNQPQIYIKAFLLSNGDRNIELHQLSVARVNEIVTEIPVETPPVVEDPIVASSLIIKRNTQLPEPVLLNASYANGNKYVDGRVEFDANIFRDDLDISKKAIVDLSQSDLDQFSVDIYYTDSTNVKQPAANKTQKIGTTKLQKITKDGKPQYVFELVAPSHEGGYVTAQLHFVEALQAPTPTPTQSVAPTTTTTQVVVATDTPSVIVSPTTAPTVTVTPIVKATPIEVFSLLANPLKNSTFTVTETGDQSDASAGNGVCDYDAGTPGSQCTLRAAIQEANALAGSDIVAFNIPTSSSGYRDYDTPGTASSGDSAGGDDYWTIQPTSMYPAITGTLTIDGTTQTSNQGDTNVYGPEIEVKGTNVVGGITLFDFSTSTNSVFNGLVVNSLNSDRYGINTGNGTVITRSYISTDVKALQIQGIDNPIYVLNKTGVVIGNDNTDGNIIAENWDLKAGAIQLIGSSSFAGSISITIAGNKFNLTQDGTAKLATNGYSFGGAILMQARGANITATIGGSTASKRNYFAGGAYGFYYENYYAATPNPHPDLGIYNNYFGTNVSGTGSFPSSQGDVYMTSQTGLPIQSGDTMKIGDTGMGNFFRSKVGVEVEYMKIYIAGNTFTSTNNFNWGTTYSMARVYSPAQPTSTVKNNYFGSGGTDPNFGITLPTNTEVGLTTLGGTNIYGNKFKGMLVGINLNRSGISVFPSILGGTSALSGSLCGGLQKNCFLNSQKYGILITDLGVTNESTIFTDNDFSAGGNTVAITKFNTAAKIELFSGTSRRTDLANGTITLSLGVPIYTDLDNILGGAGADDTPYTELTNFVDFCFYNDTVACPVSGQTSGLNNKTESLGLLSNYFYYPQYSYTDAGVKTDTKNVQLDLPHFVSNKFSFDNINTTDPVVTGSTRTDNGYTYQDRGYYWSDNPTADGIYTIASEQVMEVDYVDANPIWDGSKYTITVDSATDEDNVSTCGINKGLGAYSGGGCNGASGLPNGKTSLREAMIVANKIGGNVTIAFNIPTSDANYDSANNLWKINVGSALPNLTLAGLNLTIDGSTQVGNGTFPTYGGKIELVNSGNYIMFGSSTTSISLYINRLTLTKNTVGVTMFATSFKSFSLTNSVVRFYPGADATGWRYIAPGVTDNLIINDNYIQNVNRAISAGSATATIEIKRNILKDSGGSIGMQLTALNADVSGNVYDTNSSDAAMYMGCATGGNCKVYDNTLNMPNSNCWGGIMFSGNGRIEAYGNTISTSNVQQLSYYDGAGNPNVYFHNNTLTRTNNVPACNPGGVIAVVTKSTGGGSVLIENNTINSVLGAAVYDVHYDPTVKITMKNNILTSQSSTIAPIRINSVSADSFGTIPNISGDTGTTTNWPVITKVEYVGDGQYLLYGALDASVSKAPYDLEICLSDNTTSGHGGCSQILGHITGVSGPTWTYNTTIPGDTGSQNRTFTALATSAAGQTSIYGLNFNAVISNANYQFPISLIAEADNYFSGTTLPTFNWVASLDESVVSYEVYVNSFLVATVPSTQTSYTLTTPVTGATNWQIKAIRSNTLVSGQSSIKNFIAPYPITVISPDSTIDESKPTLAWDVSADPNIGSYKVYLDSTLVGTVDNLTTAFQYVTNNLNGAHTWQVKGYRTDTFESGESPVTNFTVAKSTTLELVSPKSGQVMSSNTPNFDWNAAKADAVTYYELYVDGKLYKTIDAASSNFQVLKTSPLSEGEHSWYVVGFFTGKNAAGADTNTEVGRTAEQKFTIKFTYDLKLTKYEPVNKDEQILGLALGWTLGGNAPPSGSFYRVIFTDPTNAVVLTLDKISVALRSYDLKSEIQGKLKANVKYTLKLELVKNNGQVLASTASNIYVSFIPLAIFTQSQTTDVLKNTDTPLWQYMLLLVAIVVGIMALIRKLFGMVFLKTSRWGGVFESVSNKKLQWVTVKLLKDGKVIEQTTTDSKGSYGFKTKEEGDYKVSVDEPGYYPVSFALALQPGKQVTMDIPLQPNPNEPKSSKFMHRVLQVIDIVLPISAVIFLIVGMTIATLLFNHTTRLLVYAAYFADATLLFSITYLYSQGLVMRVIQLFAKKAVPTK